MKKILLYLSLLISCAASAQLPTVSGFVNRNTKEQVISLMAHDQLSPPSDTTYTKLGFAIRAGIAYYGNGTYWTQLTTGTGTGYTNPLTTLGDIIYGGVSGVQTRLGGNVTAIPQTLRSTGTGSAATAPVWNDASLYIPNGELPGDQIAAIGNGRDFTNVHTTATYADGIITGCVVSYVAGLTYRVNSPCVYNINGVQYSLPGSSDVTLPDGTAGSGEFRTDAIVVTTSNTATSVTGDNSVGGVGESAQPDPSTQFLLSYVRIDEANTVPTGIGQTIIRDEGSGGEWTISKSVTSTDNYSTNPFHLTISQRITGANSGQYMQWIAPSIQSKSQFTTLLLYIRNNSALANVRNLTVTLRNGNATQVGNAINLTTYGYVKSALGSYQTIAIPMSAFAGADAFDRVRITNTQVGGTVDFQIDYVQLQSGIVTGPSTNGLTDWYVRNDSAFIKQSNIEEFRYKFVPMLQGLQDVINYNGTISNSSTVSLAQNLFIGDQIGIDLNNNLAFYGTPNVQLYGQIRLNQTYQDGSYVGSGGATGLPAGSSTDNVVTIDQTTGVLHMRSASSIGGGSYAGDSPDRASGTATANVTMDMGSNTLSITGTSGAFNVIYDNGTNTGILGVTPSIDETLIGWSKDDLSQGSLISFGSDAIVNLLGTGTFKYNADYSANFTARSLPDVGWVQQQISDSISGLISGYSESVVTAANTGNYTITSDTYIILSDLTGQANRTVTLPSGTSGKHYYIDNRDNSAFNWSFSGTVKDFAGNTVTTVVDQTVYHLIYNGSFFQIVN